MKNGWKLMKLADVCELINGRAYKKHELLAEGKYPVLRVGNFFTNNHWYYSDLELDDNKYCDAGDLLYAWSASFGPRIWTGGKVIFHYHIWKVLPNHSLINKKFLFLFFLWDTERAKEDQGTGTTMTHVSMGSMKKRDIPVPPLSEQQRIVDIFDEAFEAIAIAKSNTEKNLQNARAIFQSHLNAVFNNCGKEWGEKRIGEVCEIINGGTPKTSMPEYWDGSHLWITPAEMGKRLCPYVNDTKRKITDLGLRNSSAKMLPPYSVILSSRAPIGHLIINTEPMSTNQGCKGLIPSDHIEHKFLYYYLSSIVDLLNSLGTGATFKELSGGKLKGVMIPIAPVVEQQRIIEQIDSLCKETRRLESIYQQKVAALEELKKSLLNQAFAGEL